MYFINGGGGAVFSNARGFRRLRRPGSWCHRGFAPGHHRFRPQSGLVQREVYMPPLAAKTVQPPWRAMEMHPYSRCAGLPPKGETTHYILCVALLLQNVFAVHPGGGSSSGAMLCDTCEIIAFRSFIMPPLLWRHRNWICFVGKRSDLKIQ